MYNAGKYDDVYLMEYKYDYRNKFVKNYNCYI